MSRKRKTYSADFKVKLVLEVLEEKRSLNEIAGSYEVLPKNLLNWKKQFLENMSLAFDKSAVVKEYKEEIEVLQKNNDSLVKKVGTLTIEKDFLEGKLVSSVSFKERKAMIEREHKLSITAQCRLLHINKSSLYYKAVVPFSSQEDIKLLNAIDAIYTESPSYSCRRITQQLKKDGFAVGRKHVTRAMKLMGIVALYPRTRTTVADKMHKKYPYLLSGFKNNKNQVVIESANQVWSTDITYI